jgi:anti-anti-sigma regulatory factor
MSKEKLHAKLRASENYSFLRLRGIIDEDNSLGNLVPRLTGELLVVDLAEVERINSCGVRDWVNWVDAVAEKERKVVLIRCSPAIVTQINMVTNFADRAVVHSFFAPYYCEDCDRELQKLIETETLLGQSPVRAPSFRCSDCGGALEFDDLEESYFAFTNATDPDAIDHRLKRLVDEVSPDLEAKIRALNETGSAQLSGPLQTVGGRTPEPTPEPITIPPGYLDILDDDDTADPLAAVMRSTTPGPLVAAQVQASSALMVAFVISAMAVIGLLVYFAVTGV